MAMHINPRVTADQVRAVPEPEFTSTWRPYSHSRILDVMNSIAIEQNLPIQEQAYSLSDDGARMYGVWTIKEKTTKHIGKDTIFKALFFRNSIDKSFAFGINAGTQVHICTNLTVFGQFLEFRRHTGKLDEEELFKVATKGVIQIGERANAILQWHESLKKIALAEEQTKALAYDALREGVISRTKLANFHNLLFGESHRYDPTTLFGFHEACTDLISGLSMVGDFQAKQDNLFNLESRMFPTEMNNYPVEAA